MMENYYQLLGVEKTAGLKTIKKAYRKLAQKYHPDKYRDADKDRAKKQFKLITEAYEVLTSEEKRKKYDLRLSREAKKRKKKSGDGKAANSNNGIDLKNENLDEKFKQFFGFDPENGEKVRRKKDEKENKFSTNKIFNDYFGPDN